MALTRSEATRAYIEIRRSRRLVEQLSIWIARSDRGQDQVGAWAEFRHWIPFLEERVNAFNGTLPEGKQVPRTGDTAMFLVSAAMKIAQGVSLEKDKGSLDWVGHMFTQGDGRRAWLMVARHTLCRTPVVGRAVVPVAFVLKERKEGYLARLEVEAIAAGEKLMANHPEQSLDLSQDDFDSTFRSDFLNSLHTAFVVASAKVNSVCGRWRLLPWRLGEALPKDFDGPSLGGAALRAWALSIQGLKVDPRVVVIAQVGPAGTLEPLDANDGVYLKVFKLCEETESVDPFGSDAIDTVAVVGGANNTAALRAIRGAKAESRVRVKRIDEESINAPATAV